jgi:hypothetical protein
MLATAFVPASRLILALVLAGAGQAAMAGRAARPERDPMRSPFSSKSIWNMPIGSRAVYVPAGLSGRPGNSPWAAMPGIDEEHIVMQPDAPPTAVHLSQAGWSGQDRCGAGGGLLAMVPMPKGYVVGSDNRNSVGAFLLPDRRTIVQVQPLARCNAGAPATAMVSFVETDLYGAGIAGAHGGSGLSAIGGSIRVGELRPGAPTGPRHALKVNVYAKEALYQCKTSSDCYRWPASKADAYAVGVYGVASGNKNRAMKMGALLAIPASVPLASLHLRTAPARQLAWTLQNYGAYIVDDSYAPGFDLNVEEGPDGSVRQQFKADWGFDMMQRVTQDSPWVRDLQTLVEALHVVSNNRPGHPGGGGRPRQPLAPPISP